MCVCVYVVLCNGLASHLRCTAHYSQNRLQILFIHQDEVVTKDEWMIWQHLNELGRVHNFTGMGFKVKLGFPIKNKI